MADNSNSTNFAHSTSYKVRRILLPGYLPQVISSPFFKVLIVRHPLDRLVSVFRFFFEGHKNPVVKTFRAFAKSLLDGSLDETFGTHYK